MKDKYPDGLSIKKISDLKKYRVIGIHGFNYKQYGFGKNDKGIDTGAKDYEAAFKKLVLGRGDVVIGTFTIPSGFKAIGENIIPENVVWQKLDDYKPKGFYIFVSKKSPRAYELLTKINQAVILLNERGVTDTILKKYLSCGQDLELYEKNI